MCRNSAGIVYLRFLVIIEHIGVVMCRNSQVICVFNIFMIFGIFFNSHALNIEKNSTFISFDFLNFLVCHSVVINQSKNTKIPSVAISGGLVHYIVKMTGL